ncbi:Glycosyl transferase, family 8 [Candidatus Methylopumilus universalis]|jgi:lipopolysaccharide biosynthesis glycosyltransferase|uniref:glycosyltransferase n=1 Tax=Candidatus Methylopumilus universalis TaxID=2588536 RepID=UPI001122F6F8|nr:glycosyltransferase [Candidatus Methylopumilus universalis]QDC47865.1 glycosyltransferase [Candidatus Methylopumilus universalis]QDC72391.1 glycosyltransferase [Candidatus Methylopumilus universalis]
MADCIKIVVGFDQREAIAYHTFSQSVLEKSSLPVLFLPLSINTLKGYKETHNDKSNDFVYSRFLTPYLHNFEGWAIFADGDMVCQSDIKELWDLRDETKALQVVMHDYKTKFNQKYLGNTNENYPRKNWSSLILWNCSHPKHKVLTPDFISSQTGKYLHRFSWLDDEDIGELPIDWNWLAIEYPNNPKAKIIHYTLGTPCFKDYRNSEMAVTWHEVQQKVNEGIDK